VLVYFIVPETCGRSLEELDGTSISFSIASLGMKPFDIELMESSAVIFSLPIRIHASNKWHQLKYKLGLAHTKPETIWVVARDRLATTMNAAQEDLPSSSGPEDKLA
jgi:hypothetical protein